MLKKRQRAQPRHSIYYKKQLQQQPKRGRLEEVLINLTTPHALSFPSASIMLMARTALHTELALETATDVVPTQK